jgi:polysaccharide deacetylase family protein (PEP-CTERM system associated)
MTIINFLTIDVEDYYHVSAFEKISPPVTWAGRESRVERNTELILSMLDELSVKATFFVLGWVAQRFPQLTRKIAEQGHEIASHGYLHQRVALQNRETYRQDIRRAKALLEDQIGAEVLGYRAPSYSITRQTDWAFDELLAAGFRYDSSIFPMQHDFYGIPDWPRFSGYAVKQEKCWAASSNTFGGASFIREIPITTLRLWERNFPIAGGGYFRLLPYGVTRWGLRRINHLESQPFVFYLHPWEFDPEQPRMAGACAKSRFRHYLNLHKTEPRFRQLLHDFRFGRMRDALPQG